MEGPKKDQSKITIQTQNQQQQSETKEIKEIPKQIQQPSIKQNPKYRLLLDYQRYFNLNLDRRISSAAFNTFSIIDPLDQDRVKYSSILKIIFEQAKTYEDINLQKLDLSLKNNRGIACLLGLAICDALGASTEFIPFIKERRDLIAFDFQDVRKQIKKRVLDARSGRIGIWTDDCSMALCMADSLLLNDYKFDAKHMRYMFHMWLQHGLDNGGRGHSIGLGGNIAISMSQFVKNRQQYTAQGDKFNNGNGSLMRLAPVPICFVDEEQKAMQFSEKQSKTTHNGDQAKQCAKLLSLILVRLINRGQQNNWKAVIDKACQDFVTKVKTIQTVECLALSKIQPLQLYEKQVQQFKGKFKKFNKSPQQDRNWNWKNENFTYSKFRTYDQPGYVGSYCMDALSMALHTVWFSKSFQQIALINANMGGDCDTVGAIAGQIGGAIYGIDRYMLHLYRQMEDCKQGRFQVFIKGYKLLTHNPI